MHQKQVGIRLHTPMCIDMFFIISRVGRKYPLPSEMERALKKTDIFTLACQLCVKLFLLTGVSNHHHFPEYHDMFYESTLSVFAIISQTTYCMRIYCLSQVGFLFCLQQNSPFWKSTWLSHDCFIPIGSDLKNGIWLVIVTYGFQTANWDVNKPMLLK